MKNLNNTIPVETRVKMLIARAWALTLLPLEAICSSFFKF